MLLLMRFMRISILVPRSTLEVGSVLSSSAGARDTILVLRDPRAVGEPATTTETDAAQSSAVELVWAVERAAQ